MKSAWRSGVLKIYCKVMKELCPRTPNEYETPTNNTLSQCDNLNILDYPQLISRCLSANNAAPALKAVLLPALIVRRWLLCSLPFALLLDGALLLWHDYEVVVYEPLEDVSFLFFIQASLHPRFDSFL